MTSSKPTKRIDRLLPRGQVYDLRTLMAVGAIVHFAATLTLFIVGRFGLLPSWVSVTGAMRGDAPGYMTSIGRLSRDLWAGDPSFLFTYQEQIHLRLYSLSHSVFSGFSGHNILALEPVNLGLFLLTLFLVYKIGESLFEPRIGFIASYAVLVFPSFLLHSTQPFRDNLFIAVFLLLIYQLLRAIQSSYNALASLIAAAAGSATFLLLWFVRDSMFWVYVGIGCLALFAVFTKSIRDRKYVYNCIVVGALIVFAFLSSASLSSSRPLKAGETALSRERKNFERGRRIRRSGNPLIRRVNRIRSGFAASYKDAGSDIDDGFVIKDMPSLVVYLPRAFAIGLLSPFPNMWFAEGKEFGQTGRLVAGFETLVFYVFIVATIFLFVSERNTGTIFIFLSAVLGALALGLTVTNVGTIYRLRYGFWILTIILGIKGLSLAVKKFGPSLGEA